jgi:carbonic anhydrase/acetyltransferase-like protein (isoleucine patch superfamily)
MRFKLCLDPRVSDQNLIVKGVRPMAESFELQDNVFIHDTAFVAPNATVIGNVRIEAHASVWFQAVIRAEQDTVTIGERSNIQDGTIVHVDEGNPVVIGKNVTVGHRAVIHGATVEDNCIVGIGAILLNGSRVGANSIVGAGALVPEGKSYPPNSVLMGIPAKVVKTLTDEQAARVAAGADHYVMFGAAYARKLGDLI